MESRQIVSWGYPFMEASVMSPRSNETDRLGEELCLLLFSI